MGIFNYVKHEVKCPICGNLVNRFQTKDGDCALSTVNYWEVSNFYDTCEKCGTWIEYNLKEFIPISAYKMTVKKEAVR